MTKVLNEAPIYLYFSLPFLHPPLCVPFYQVIESEASVGVGDAEWVVALEGPKRSHVSLKKKDVEPQNCKYGTNEGSRNQKARFASEKPLVLAYSS